MKHLKLLTCLLAIGLVSCGDSEPSDTIEYVIDDSSRPAEEAAKKLVLTHIELSGDYEPLDSATLEEIYRNLELLNGEEEPEE